MRMVSNILSLAIDYEESRVKPLDEQKYKDWYVYLLGHLQPPKKSNATIFV